MALDIDQLVSAMAKAGEGLGDALWGDMQTYVLPELKIIAEQFVTIEAHKSDYTEAGAKDLVDQQIDALVAEIVAATSLTELAVQNAINQILMAVKSMVNTAVGFALL